MPAWLDAFVNGHSSPEALAIVDEFLRTREWDVRRESSPPLQRLAGRAVVRRLCLVGEHAGLGGGGRAALDELPGKVSRPLYNRISADVQRQIEDHEKAQSDVPSA